MDIDTRPRPLLDNFKTLGTALSTIGGFIAYLSTLGVLNADQLRESNAVIAIVPGVVAVIGGLLASFGVVKKSEPAVTPVADPAVVVDGRLVPLEPRS